MLVDTVRVKMQEATKSGDSVRAQTLKMLMAALEYKRGQKMADFNEADELSVIRSEAKKRQEAVEIYTQAGAPDRAESEAAELKILEEFLPAQASEEDIRKVVEELKDKAPGKGQLIGMVIGRMGKDKVDGTVVAKIVNEVA
jgi:uncharacterized protein YqeY